MRCRPKRVCSCARQGVMFPICREVVMRHESAPHEIRTLRHERSILRPLSRVMLSVGGECISQIVYCANVVWFDAIDHVTASERPDDYH